MISSQRALLLHHIPSTPSILNYGQGRGKIGHFTGHQSRRIRQLQIVAKSECSLMDRPLNGNSLAFRWNDSSLPPTLSSVNLEGIYQHFPQIPSVNLHEIRSIRLHFLLQTFKKSTKFFLFFVPSLHISFETYPPFLSISFFFFVFHPLSAFIFRCNVSLSLLGFCHVF